MECCSITRSMCAPNIACGGFLTGIGVRMTRQGFSTRGASLREPGDEVSGGAASFQELDQLLPIKILYVQDNKPFRSEGFHQLILDLAVPSTAGIHLRVVS